MGVIKTFNGLARANVKTHNGLALASVKSWNGMDAVESGGVDWTDLISYFPLNETSGTRSAIVGSETAAPSSGSVGYGTGLVYANAASVLTANVNWLSSSNASAWNSSNAFTICIWVKPDSPGDYSGIMTTFNSNTFSAQRRDATRLRITIAGVTQDYSHTWANAWTFLAFGYSDSDNTMFASVNGAAKQSWANNNSRNTSATTLSIGLGESGSAYTWKGLLGPAYIFSSIISDARIAEQYNSGSGRAYP